jgi:hypothetical protein
MLLAEVGLPPGAEVDRDSLEAVLHDGRSDVYRYDVQPDRVVLYLWPPMDSAPFSFDFHACFGMGAKSAASFPVSSSSVRQISVRRQLLSHS